MTAVYACPQFRKTYEAIGAGKNTALHAAVNNAVTWLEDTRSRYRAWQNSSLLADGWMALLVQAALEKWLLMWRYRVDEDVLDLRALVPWPEDVPPPMAYSRG